MNFQTWMQEVDEICLRKYLMSIYDLPDMEFLSAFEDGQTPEGFMTETIPDHMALGDLILS